jgi:hypothetical protein
MGIEESAPSLARLRDDDLGKTAPKEELVEEPSAFGPLLGGIIAKGPHLEAEEFREGKWILFADKDLSAK